MGPVGEKPSTSAGLARQQRVLVPAPRRRAARPARDVDGGAPAAARPQPLHHRPGALEVEQRTGPSLTSAAASGRRRRRARRAPVAQLLQRQPAPAERSTISLTVPSNRSRSSSARPPPAPRPPVPKWTFFSRTPPRASRPTSHPAPGPSGSRRRHHHRALALEVEHRGADRAATPGGTGPTVEPRPVTSAPGASAASVLKGLPAGRRPHREAASMKTLPSATGSTAERAGQRRPATREQPHHPPPEKVRGTRSAYAVSVRRPLAPRIHSKMGRPLIKPARRSDIPPGSKCVCITLLGDLGYSRSLGQFSEEGTNP